MWYIHTVDYYLAIKRNEIMKYAQHRWTQTIIIYDAMCVLKFFTYFLQLLELFVIKGEKCKCKHCIIDNEFMVFSLGLIKALWIQWRMSLFLGNAHLKYFFLRERGSENLLLLKQSVCVFICVWRKEKKKKNNCSRMLQYVKLSENYMGVYCTSIFL